MQVFNEKIDVEDFIYGINENENVGQTKVDVLVGLGTLLKLVSRERVR